MSSIAASFMSDFGVNGSPLFVQVVISFLPLLILVGLIVLAVKLILLVVASFEKSDKAQQDTVYLLREIAALLKSKEEKKP